MYIGNAKYADRPPRLIPFEFSIDQAYMLEVGNEYIRFWANRVQLTSGGVPVEVATPYQQSELRDLRFAQSADVLYITHRHHQPMKLQRLTATSFVLSPINFLPPPSFEQEVAPDTTLTLTATTGTVTATLGLGFFLAGDQGREITSGVGRGIITAVLSTTSVTLEIVDDFLTTGPIASGDWTMTGSPNFGTATASAKEPLRGTSTVTTSVASFRAADVGKFIHMSGGIIKITTVASASSVSGQIMLTLDTLTAAPSGSWTLEAASWSDLLGWPGVVTLFQQRTWWAGSTNFPDSIWASVTGDFENLARGALDDDAIDYTLAESGVNLIRWLKAGGNGLRI